MNAVVNYIDTAYSQFILSYLQRFFPVSNEQAAFIMNHCEIRSFDKKCVVLQEGEIENYLSMVVKGLVRKYLRRGKSEFTLQLGTEGHLVHSEISYLKRIPSMVILEAIEPTVLVSISHEKMQIVLDSMPGADRIGRLLLTAMFIKKDERHYKQLGLSTRERFLEYMNNHAHMLQRVPQKYLASYLSIKPETFSRLKHLVKIKK